MAPPILKYAVSCSNSITVLLYYMLLMYVSNGGLSLVVRRCVRRNLTFSRGREFFSCNGNYLNGTIMQVQEYITALCPTL